MIFGGAVALGVLAFAAKKLYTNAKHAKENENNPSRVVKK